MADNERNPKHRTNNRNDNLIVWNKIEKKKADIERDMKREIQTRKSLQANKRQSEHHGNPDLVCVHRQKLLGHTYSRGIEEKQYILHHFPAELSSGTNQSNWQL